MQLMPHNTGLAPIAPARAAAAPASARCPCGARGPARRVRARAAPGSPAPPGAPPVVIAGAGIGGLAAAVALHRIGLRPLVLERAPAMREEGGGVALWANAWRALDALGVAEELRAASPTYLDRFELVRSDGRLMRGFGLEECDDAAAGGEAAEFRGVRRAMLLEALAAALPDGCVRFGVGVDGVEEEGAGRQGPGSDPVVRLSDGSRLECSLLIGADGSNSVVARHLGLAPPNYAGYTAYRGVAVYPGGKRLPLPPTTVRQIYGAGVRAGMYPLSESEVYWFTCFNAPEDAPAPPTPEGRVAEALSCVDGWQWGISDAIKRTPPEVLSRSRVRDRWTFSDFGPGRVTLVGDAAHPMTPNLGQGGCAALEDSVVLARELRAALDDISGGSTDVTGGSASSNGVSVAASAEGSARIEAALRRYEAERRARCLPLTLKSWAFGAALQLPYPPVLAARDAFMAKAFSPKHFLSHTAYDVGVLV